MSGIILRPPWTRQPQTPAGVDLGNPLTKGMTFAYQPLRGAALANALGTGPTFTATGSLGLQPTAQGRWSGLGLELSGTGQYLTSTRSLFTPTSGASPFSMAVIARVDAIGANEYYLFSLGNSGGNNPVRGLATSSVTSGRASFFMRDDSGAPTGHVSTSNAFAAGDIISIVGVNASGTSRKCVLNGNIGSAGTSATDYSAATITNDISAIGALSRATPALALNGNVLLAVFWNRALSDAEIIEFDRNPWQIFAPLPRRLWVGAAAVGGASNAPRYFHRTQAGMS